MGKTFQYLRAEEEKATGVGRERRSGVGGGERPSMTFFCNIETAPEAVQVVAILMMPLQNKKQDVYCAEYNRRYSLSSLRCFFSCRTVQHGFEFNGFTMRS